MDGFRWGRRGELVIAWTTCRHVYGGGGPELIARGLESGLVLITNSFQTCRLKLKQKESEVHDLEMKLEKVCCW